MPLIFYVLTGYFRSEPDKLKTEGLFRITSAGSKMRELEAHLRAGNFCRLSTLMNSYNDNHMVTNMIKRTLINMKSPLIPYNLYHKFAELGNYEGRHMTRRVQELV